MQRAASIAVLVLLVSLPPSGTAGEAPALCGVEAPVEKAPAAAPNPYPGIVPNGGLIERDFEDGGLLIEIDPSLGQITSDPYGVVRRAAANWEIPGTMIKFRYGSNGNVIKAAPVRQQAYATIGKPGLGEAGALSMTIRTPFHDGDDRLESIITHEIGHWLGFDHSFLMETVMSPILNDRINWVDPDQIAKAVLRYGTGPHAVGTVRGRVTRRGEGLSGARVNLIGDDGRTAFGTFAAADGTYSVPVYTGTYRLFVDPNDGPAVKGNFFGTYPGGPLDFVTCEAAGQVVVSAGATTVVDMAVPEGDHLFRITTIEPRTAPPGASVQRVEIYFDGAQASEIAGLELLANDVTITSHSINGERITAYVDFDNDALPGPRALILRKTNGAFAIVPGLVGVVAPFRLAGPHYTSELDAAAPVRVEWEGGVAGEEISAYVASASIDGGRTWEEIGRAPAEAAWLDWDPRGLTSPMLRVRVAARTADGRTVATDESIFNHGLGAPAAATPREGDDAGPPVVRVLSPNGGEVAAAGEPIRVSWEASDDFGLAQQLIELSADGGRTWTQSATLGPVARTADMAMAAEPGAPALVRVTVRDLAGNSTADTSDAPLSVRRRPSISRVAVKAKAVVSLKLTGVGFETGATVFVNGAPVGVAARFNAAAGRLTLKGDAASLRLNPAGQENSVAVEVAGLASSSATFTSP